MALHVREAEAGVELHVLVDLHRRARGAAELTEALRRLPDWSVTAGKDAISRSFKVADFGAAFGFMTRAALIAEKMDHHPDWSNAYNRVNVTLSTHSAGGITDNDILLAEAMDRIAAG